MQRCCKINATLVYSLDRRTEEQNICIEFQIPIQASLMFPCYSMLLHQRCCVYDSTFVGKNRRFFLLLLLRILCFALQFFCHDGHSDVWAEACFCTNRRMGIICILMFLCSCVFYLLLHPAFVKFRSLVLVWDDGSLALLCLLVDAHFLKTEEHKNKREH